MRRFFKQCIAFVLIPAVRWYLRKERKFIHHNIQVKVLPGVFHPGLFHSTKFLSAFLLTQSLRHQSLLELGCGTGFISILCAKNGAVVTASDVSQHALENISMNVAFNQVSVAIVHSDVFDRVPKKTFDWIVINPPYYAKAPANEDEMAWYCGKDFEYFHKLFENLKGFTHATTNTIMVLTQGCELEKIFAIADKNRFQLELMRERTALFDGKDFLYKISAC
jgi:release factor glutamine methyltransferase